MCRDCARFAPCGLVTCIKNFPLTGRSRRRQQCHSRFTTTVMEAVSTSRCEACDWGGVGDVIVRYGRGDCIASFRGSWTSRWIGLTCPQRARQPRGHRILKSASPHRIPSVISSRTCLGCHLISSHLIFVTFFISNSPFKSCSMFTLFPLSFRLAISPEPRVRVRVEPCPGTSVG